MPSANWDNGYASMISKAKTKESKNSKVGSCLFLQTTSSLITASCCSYIRFHSHYSSYLFTGLIWLILSIQKRSVPQDSIQGGSSGILPSPTIAFGKYKYRFGHFSISCFSICIASASFPVPETFVHTIGNWWRISAETSDAWPATLWSLNLLLLLSQWLDWRW